MHELLDVIHVKALPNYELLLEFENGELKIFDVKPLLDKGVFVALKEESVFESVGLENGTVVWPNEIDIAPETLYVRSVSIKQ